MWMRSARARAAALSAAIRRADPSASGICFCSEGGGVMNRAADARRVVAGIAMALSLSGCEHHALTPAPRGGGASLVMPIVSPLGGESLGVEWGAIEVANGGSVLVAVARPSGEGPFPLVIILHGTHGFARE